MTIVSDIQFIDSKHKLGRLCSRKHNYNDTGLSLRFKRNSDCVYCCRERMEEKRKSKNKKLIFVSKVLYDPLIYSLSNLCRKGHDYEGTGRSLRSIKTNACYHCRKNNYNKHRDSILEYMRKYSEEHKEQISLRNKQYKAKNRDFLIVQNREYYAKNKIKILAQKQIYAQLNKEAIKSYRTSYYETEVGKAAKRRSNQKREYQKKNKRIINYSGRELVQRYKIFNGRCVYCNAATDITSDHVIPLSRIQGIDRLQNIVPACRSCNSRKRISDVIPWYKKQPFFDPERLLCVLFALGEDELRTVFRDVLNTCSSP